MPPQQRAAMKSPQRMSLIDRQNKQAQDFAILRARSTIKLDVNILAPKSKTSTSKEKEKKPKDRSKKENAGPQHNLTGTKGKDKIASELSTPVKADKVAPRAQLARKANNLPHSGKTEEKKRPSAASQGQPVYDTTLTRHVKSKLVQQHRILLSDAKLREKRQAIQKATLSMKTALDSVEQREQERLLEIHKRKEAARLRRQKEQEIARRQRAEHAKLFRQEEEKRKETIIRARDEFRHGLLAQLEKSKRERELRKMGVDPVLVARCSAEAVSSDAKKLGVKWHPRDASRISSSIKAKKATRQQQPRKNNNNNNNNNNNSNKINRSFILYSVNQKSSSSKGSQKVTYKQANRTKIFP